MSAGSAEAGRCPGCFATPVAPGAASGACPACGFDPAAEVEHQGELPIGTLLRERYEVGRVLGRGGFGITYLAWDVRLRRRRALKEYFPSGLASREEVRTEIAITPGQTRVYSNGLTKYLEEARLLAQFELHPCIVSPLDFFEANGTAYLVMEFLEGETLASYVHSQGGRIPYAHAVHYLRPVLEALASVHRAGILHRDVSPENIFLTVDGRAKLIDFGAARQRLAGETGALTVILRERYAPPEQYTSTGRQGPWTDLYAFAAVFYLAITGKPPPSAPERWLDDRLQRPTRLGVEIPAPAERALLAALSLRVEDRPQQVEGLLDLLSAPAAGRAPTPDPPVARARMRLVDVHRSVSGWLERAATRGARWLGQARARATRTTIGATLGVVGSALLLVLASSLEWSAGVPSSGPAAAEDGRAPASPPASPGDVAGEGDRSPPGGGRDAQTPIPPVGVYGPSESVPPPDSPQSTPGVIGEDEGDAVEPVLPPAIEPARLVVRSLLTRDTLEIDGVRVGATDAREHSLAPGRHRIRVLKEGYLPFEQEIELVAGQKLVLQAKLSLDPVFQEKLLETARGELASDEVDQRRAGLERLRQIADRGYAPAMTELGRGAVLGELERLGVDRAQGEDWLARASDLGASEAAYLRGLRLELGAWPVSKDGRLDVSAPLPERGAIRRLFVDSTRDFVRDLQANATPGDAASQASAAKLYRAAAAKGHAGAQERLGYMYAAGRGLEQSPQQAFFWLLKAAQAGRPDAQYAVGMCYHAGEGYAPSLPAATCWLARASAAGHSGARTELARIDSAQVDSPAPKACSYPPVGAPGPER